MQKCTQPLCRHYASSAATARRAGEAIRTALHRRESLSQRMTFVLRGWDGHHVLSRALQVSVQVF